MSWYVTTGNVPVEKVEEAIRQLELPPTTTAPYSVETLDQFYAAKEAAILLFQRGAVGAEGEYSASVSGHTTEGFHNVNGVSPSSVTVSVHQVYQPEK